MSESEQRFLAQTPMPPWHRWLVIAFGILLPVFFGAVGCWFVLVSRAPFWAMAIGVILGIGWGIVWNTSNHLVPHSKKLRSWLGGISAATLMTTLWLTAEQAGIPRLPASLAFTIGYVFSYAVGLFVGVLSFNAVASWLRK